MMDAFGQEQMMDLEGAKAIRQSCDECSSRAIDIDVWPEMRPRLTPQQVAEFRVGARYMEVRLERCVVWRCLSCDNLGLFGPWGVYT